MFAQEENPYLHDNLNIFRNRFFIFVQIGAAMILFSSLKPFFAANQVPGALIFILSIFYDKWWPTAYKKRLYGISACLLAMSMWIGANSFFLWNTPSAPATVSLTDGISTPQLTITMGLIGHILVIIGAIEGIKGLRQRIGM